MENQNSQEIKNKKRILKRYKNNLKCIERLEDKISLLDSRIKSVSSPNYSGMPRGANPVTKEDLVNEKTDLEARVKRLKDKGKIIKAEIIEEIDSLDDVRYCEVLEAFFIDCKTIEEIAEDMGYTDRYIYDLYKDAIEELSFQ